MSARVAAFFDLDGTLLPLPSLEQRFFHMLRDRREIPLKNYFLWLRETLKLLPHGTDCVMHSNKMYLKGLRVSNESAVENGPGSSARKSGHKDEGWESTPPRRNPRWPVPHFFEEGVELVVWHATQGHAIVIVSGTLEPLANIASQALEAELAFRGIAAKIRVCATRLEESDSQWTGRILGQVMFGREKVRAILALAEEMSLDLSRSWAHGDSAQDRWMLASVGNPATVNPTPRLARIARKQGWPIFRTTNRVQIGKPVWRAEGCV